MATENYYYQLAHEASKSYKNHPGLKYLFTLCHSTQVSDVLDVGCGDGTRLNLFLPKNKKGTGIDSSRYAIKTAQKQFTNHLFFVQDAQNLEFKSESFDLVYSAFALEHCQNPTAFVTEMIRVCRPGGFISIIAPNYGSANRRSPVSVENPIQKFIQGVILDIQLYLTQKSTLDFTKVSPKENYLHSDDDTTYEPYHHTLESFLNYCGMEVITSDSMWSIEPKTINLRKSIFCYLGRQKFPMFRYWGPQIFLVAKKCLPKN